MSVYKAINAVQADLCREGLAKDQTNTFDNYKFRGIDAVYNALSPLLAKHGLCILPRMISRDVQERQSQKGGALFYVTVEAEFDFVAVSDGSRHTVRTFGEAMDRGDKATNKAMSAAYKYAAFQAFAIPTEGDNDADASTHEVKSAPTIPARPTNAQLNIDPETERYLQDLAEEVAELAKADPQAADEKIRLQKLEGDQEIALANMLDSTTRAAVRKARQAHMAKLKAEAGFSRA